MPLLAISRRSSWWITVPAAGGTVAWLFLVFFPGIKAIRDVRADVRSTQDFVAQAQMLLPTIERSEGDLADVERYVAEQESRAPREDQLTAFFGQVAKVATQVGTVTSKFEPQAPLAMQALQKVPVTLSTAGTNAEICALVCGLERLPAPMWIEELHLEGPREGGQDVQCDLKLAVFAASSDNSD
jgi:Tfp pilus assembly protein PilO